MIRKNKYRLAYTLFYGPYPKWRDESLRKMSNKYTGWAGWEGLLDFVWDLKIFNHET